MYPLPFYWECLYYRFFYESKRLFKATGKIVFMPWALSLGNIEWVVIVFKLYGRLFYNSFLLWLYHFCVVYCFECVCYFVFFVYCIVLCIVVPLPLGTYPLSVNNNNNNNTSFICVVVLRYLYFGVFSDDLFYGVTIVTVLFYVMFMYLVVYLAD
jgi:hypothetical protein